MSQPLLQYASIMEVHLKPSLGGKLQYVSDLNDVELDISNGSQAVHTFGADEKKGGLGGFSRGAVETIVAFKSATRIEGAPEFDWVDAIVNFKILTLLGYIVGDTSGKRVQLEGMPQTIKQGFGLGKPSMADIRIHCGRPKYVR